MDETVNSTSSRSSQFSFTHNKKPHNQLTLSSQDYENLMQDKNLEFFHPRSLSTMRVRPLISKTIQTRTPLEDISGPAEVPISSHMLENLHSTFHVKQQSAELVQEDIIFQADKKKRLSSYSFHVGKVSMTSFKFAAVRNPFDNKWSCDEGHSKGKGRKEDEELEVVEEVAPQQDVEKTPPAKPVLRLTSEDVAGELKFWSTSVVCYILGANPPSSVLNGYVKRVWQGFGVDKIAFMPNGLFLVRFKTKEKQQLVLNNGHLIFDNKPVIVKAWEPDMELVKHDVKRVPIWIKLYGLDVKFWGTDCLRKISGIVGAYIESDEATQNRDFLGYARIMVEVNVDQEFPTEIGFFDENGKQHYLRVMYDWLPITCGKCKGMGHETAKCRRGEGKPATKVWKPKPGNAATVAGPGKKNVKKGPVQQVNVPVQKVTADAYATNVSTAPTQQRAATVERGIVTPVIVSKPVVEQSMPRRLLTRMMRQESGEKRVFIPGGLSFMEALSHSIQKTRDRIVEKGERSRVLVDNGLHSGGRVWLLWDPSMFDVNVKDVTAQAIHSEVCREESLWNSIRDYHRGINGPWVVCGDFNAILDFNERIGGAPVSYADVLPLAQVTQDCNLADLKATGAFFTWNNKHETGDKVYSRIDRVMINDDWITTFPDSVANFLPEGLFDHCPCLISLECSHQQRTKSFKYFNMWAFSKEFDSTVRNCWSTVVQGTPMFRVVQKLKLLKKAFRNLNREKFSDIENLTNVAELALKDIQYWEN
ncbi:uncharacterized protein LOC141641582 [Silene latifolia]|uniref:uncharacterized protein LOC141641582 n=1 Tax=Silene latifolia TaxID=37657 RepID=UPI003D778442